MAMKVSNNAASTLASGITSGATSLTVASGQGSLFPALGVADYFYCTLANVAGAVEIVQVTARSTDTFTVVRGLDGTTAAAWSAGDKVELRLVAASLNDFAKLDENNTFSGALTLSAGTANGVAYLNGSKVVTTGSALTFDGTVLLAGAGGTGTNNSILKLSGSSASSYGAYLQFLRNGTPTWSIGNDSAINGGSSDDLTIYGTASQRFYASGSEQMRLTSTGLGIGTSSPSVKLDVVGTAKFSGGGGYVSYGDNGYIRTDIANKLAFQVGTSGATWRTSGNSGDLMLLDNSGNLGLGATTAGAKLDVQGGGTAGVAGGIRINSFSSNPASTGLYLVANIGVTKPNWMLGAQYNLDQAFEITPSTVVNGTTFSNPVYAVTNAGFHKWFNGSTQAMTLDVSGNLLVGTTSSSPTNGNWLTSLPASAGAYHAIGHASGTPSGNYFQAFYYNASPIGSITQSGTTAVLYNLTSDQRLKENIVDAEPSSALIDAIQVRQYDWKSDGSHQRYGFIAQELVTVAPEAVHQPADPEEMMAVDYSKLVPMLVKEIQSLRKRLADAGI